MYQSRYYFWLQFFITENHVIFGDSETSVDPVSGDFLGALLCQGPHPDANVGGDHVHHAEASDALELVDVQLDGVKRNER